MAYLDGQIILNQREAGSEGTHTEQMGYLRYNLLDRSQSDTATVATTIRTFLIGVSGLTTGTYIDGTVRYDASLNEEAERE